MSFLKSLCIIETRRSLFQINYVLMTFRYSTLYGRKQTSSELKIIEVLNQTLYKEHLCIRGAVLDFERKF